MTTVPWHATGSRGQDPDEPVAVEIGLGVDEEVRQVVDVAVVGPPPHDGGIGHVLVVLVHQRGAGLGLGGLAQRLVDVVVVPELLDDEAGGEAEGATRCTRHCRLSVPGAAGRPRVARVRSISVDEAADAARPRGVARVRGVPPGAGAPWH